MSKDVLLGIFGIPAALGGVYLLCANPKTKRQRLLASIIGVYDLVFFITFHWWLKVF
jgi:hypothetical protein